MKVLHFLHTTVAFLLLSLIIAGGTVLVQPYALSAQAAEDDAEPYTGWKEKNGKKYYYKNGKKVTGWKKIDGKWYYFNDSGRLQTNKIVGDKKNGYYYVDSDGVRVTDKTIKAAVSFVTENSDSSKSNKKRLKQCFKALCKYPYVRSYDGAPTASTVSKYARQMFTNKGGNCYRYATAMAYIARVLGYDVRVAEGGVTAHSYGSLSAHGWCEVKIGSSWEMIDCSMQRGYPKENLFLVKRKDYPFRLRCDNTYKMKIKNGKVSWK